MLIGRDRERERLDALLKEARLGRSRALVLRGSAGIGKTLLLDYAVQQASGFQVLHYTAVESEAELPFAGLQALLGRLLVHLPEIPEPQARALRGALALEASANVNRLAVYAGALSLLGVAAERVPLLVVVDDAHWLDRPSAEALTFAARRLTAESLALLFAVREGEGTDLGVALPTIELEPLEVAASMELLHERFGSTIAAKVARHLAEATGGNPLALLEVARAARARQNASGASPFRITCPLPRASSAPCGARFAAFLQRRVAHCSPPQPPIRRQEATSPRWSRPKMPGSSASTQARSRSGTRSYALRSTTPLRRTSVERPTARSPTRSPAKRTPTGAPGTSQRPPKGRTSQSPRLSKLPPRALPSAAVKRRLRERSSAQPSSAKTTMRAPAGSTPPGELRNMPATSSARRCLPSGP